MILFILPKFSGGGAERVTLNLLSELKSRNYSVGIIVFDKSGPLLSIIPHNIPIYNLGTHTLRRSIIPLIRELRILKPKVIFSTFGYINVILLLTRKLLLKKTKIWIREANLPSISLPNNPYPKLMSFLYKFTYGKSDKLICTSVKMKDEFVNNFSINNAIIKILPNPIDVELVRSLSTTIMRFDNGGTCFVSSGRLTIQKGFDRLLLWFSMLENKKSTLVILGDGELKCKLINKVKFLNIQDQVKFLGFCNNPWQWYAGADVFLLPSYWEGMPNVVLESLACGTPVIATSSSGGILEIEQQACSGAVTVTHDEAKFLQAMRGVVVHTDLKLRHSLLPHMFQLDSVLNEVENLLNDY
jgi:glycosyltransferase involved in cell wall biosynthesis